MRVLVTGGAGFLGYHVSAALLAEGHALTVLDDLSSGLVDNLPAGTPLLKADISEPLDRLIREAQPEVIVHLAAQVSVPDSVAAPLRDLAVNTGGTINLLQAAAKAGVRKVISISSAAVYGAPERLPLKETDPLRPLSPYGVSKLAAEQYIRALAPMLGLSYTILRPANVYGPKQRSGGEGAVVPSFLGRFVAGKDPVIHGDGRQTRDFLCVTDIARAVSLALHRGDGETLNISSGEGCSILHLWDVLAGLTGWGRAPVFAAPRVGDITHSVLCNQAAREKLGWAPTVPLEVGLAETVKTWQEIDFTHRAL